VTELGAILSNTDLNDEKAGHATRAVSTTPITAAVTDGVILCDCTSTAITINLPAASGNDGLYYSIKKIDSSANAVTVDGSGSETIDDGLTAVLNNQYESITIVCDGTEWWII
jgi:hypothetical protein